MIWMFFIRRLGLTSETAGRLCSPRASAQGGDCLRVDGWRQGEICVRVVLLRLQFLQKNWDGCWIFAKLRASSPWRNAAPASSSSVYGLRDLSLPPSLLPSLSPSLSFPLSLYMVQFVRLISISQLNMNKIYYYILLFSILFLSSTAGESLHRDDQTLTEYAMRMTGRAWRKVDNTGVFHFSSHCWNTLTLNTRIITQINQKPQLLLGLFLTCNF